MTNVRTVIWKRAFVLVVALAATLSAAAAQVRVRAVGLTPAPRAVYGTVSTYDDAKKLLTLLGGAITVDVSHARIVGLNGFDTLNPLRPGLQVSIQLEASGAPGSPLPAWLVEQKTESAASMAGSIDNIDLAAGTFTTAGVVIRPTAATVWKGARGADVRSLAELQLGQAVNLILDRDDRGVIAQQIFVIGFIPPMAPQVWGFVTKIEGDLWTITPTDGPAVVVRVTSTTLFNSTDGLAQPGLGEFVEVTTSLPNGNGPLVALVITDFPPPQQQIAYSYGVYGTLTELKADSLTVTDLNGHTLTLPVDPSTKFFRDAKLGDYVEVRVRVDDATKTQVVVQVIKANRFIRLGFTGVVTKIEGDTWTFKEGGWTVIVTPQTRLINNPRVGDEVRVVGQTEHGSRTIQADEIERL
jgi:hypothetical protein